MSDVGDFSYSWFLGDRTQVKKEKEKFVVACLLTSYIKREIRHFHVVVVQWRQRNAWCKGKVVVLLNKPIAFFYFFEVLVAVVVVVAKAHKNLSYLARDNFFNR